MASVNIPVRSQSGGIIRINKRLLLEKSPFIRTRLENTPMRPVQALLLQQTTENIKILKRFVEEGNFEFTSLDQTYELYEMAKLYQIERMVILCRNYIITQINPDTACTIHDFSCHQIDRTIQYHCWRIFDERWPEIITSESFYQCELTTIDTFFTRPKYSTLNELSLFRSSIIWATRTHVSDDDHPELPDRSINRIRRLMNPFFNKIRFLAMDSAEMQFALTHDVFYEEEEEAFASYINDGDLRILPPTICDNIAKRTEACYKSLIDYKHHSNLIVPDNRTVTADSQFRCRFIPREDCFLYEVIMPIIMTENVSVEIKIETENNLFHRANYTCRESSITILDPLFFEKNDEYLLSGNLDLENINSEMKIKENSEFYMEESEYQHIEESKKNEALSNWNEYLTKIRLYF